MSVADRDQVRDMLHTAVAQRKVANELYRNAVTLAKREGWNNSQIARACGVSEAAIRRYWKRISSASS